MKILMKFINDVIDSSSRNLIQYVFQDIDQSDHGVEIDFVYSDPTHPHNEYDLVLLFGKSSHTGEHKDCDSFICPSKSPTGNTRVIYLESIHWYTLIPQRALQLKFHIEYAIKYPARKFIYAGYITELPIKDTSILPYGVYVLDIETTGLNFMTDSILCIALYDGRISYILDPDTEGLSEFLIRESFVMHNGKFDSLFLHKKYGFYPVLCDDTMLMAYSLDETQGTQGLKHLSQKFLGFENYEEEIKPYIKGKNASYANIPTELLNKYAVYDVAATGFLYQIFLEENLPDSYRFMMNLSPVIMELEQNGMEVDFEKLDEIEIQLTEKKTQLLEDIHNLADGLNPNSPKQLAEFLYDRLGLKFIPQDKEKSRSTAKGILLRLCASYPDQSQFIEDVLEYREVGKLLSTFVMGIREQTDFDGRCRPSYLLHGTVTGRLSSRNPNAQNIPRPTKSDHTAELRNIFVAPQGKVLVGADYSQAELRVAATLAHEESMKRVWDNGGDLHSATCEQIFGEVTPEKRTIAKTLNFGVLYGLSASALSSQLKISVPEADQYINRFFAGKPNLRDWLTHTRYKAENHRVLHSRNGRTRHFGQIFGNTVMDQTTTQAGNFEIQSLASDITLQAILDLYNSLFKFGLGKLVCTVHDSIYVECSDDPETIKTVENLVKNTMLKAAPKILGEDYVKFDVDIHHARKWGEL